MWTTKHARVTQVASDEPGPSMVVYFVAGEMESAMKIDPDPTDPLGTPNMEAGTQNQICIGSDNYF